MNDNNDGSSYYLLNIYYMPDHIYKLIQLSYQPQVVSAITLPLHVMKIEIYMD